MLYATNWELNKNIDRGYTEKCQKSHGGGYEDVHAAQPSYVFNLNGGRYARRSVF